MFDPSIAQASLITGTLTTAIGLVGVIYTRRNTILRIKESEASVTKTLVDTMREVNAELRTQIAEVKSKLEALEAERDQLISRIAALEVQLNAAISERDRLRVELAQVDTEIVKLRAQLDILSNAKPVIVEVNPVVHTTHPTGA